MALARVVVHPGAMVGIVTGVVELQDKVLGPLITADAIRYAPERSGELKASLHHYMDGTTLIIEASAPYSAWVELGHRVFHPSTGLTGPEIVPEEPYLRPALYKYRSPDMLEPPAFFPIAVGHPGGPTYPNLIMYEEDKLNWHPSKNFQVRKGVGA
jgi:hypothetical protein